MIHTDQREILSKRMQCYYQNNVTYHNDVSGISGDRPSEEEKQLFRSIRKSLGQLIEHNSLKVLEIGCGTCDSVKGMIEIIGIAPKNYFGIDATIPAIEKAKQKYPEYNLISGDAVSLPFDNEVFEVTFFNYVLEHMVYPDLLLKEASRVTKKGGIVAMIVPVSDLPWLLPSSLRSNRKNVIFLLGYTLSRWVEFCRIRYQKDFFQFRAVNDPMVLLAKDAPHYQFEPDDDLIYNGSSFEIKKYLESLGHQIVSFEGRSVKPCIQNGRNWLLDFARIITFALLRLTLNSYSEKNFTTTTLIISKKT